VNGSDMTHADRSAEIRRHLAEENIDRTAMTGSAATLRSSA
jgi:hypothetical protein